MALALCGHVGCEAGRSSISQSASNVTAIGEEIVATIKGLSVSRGEGSVRGDELEVFRRRQTADEEPNPQYGRWIRFSEVPQAAQNTLEKHAFDYFLEYYRQWGSAGLMEKETALLTAISEDPTRRSGFKIFVEEVIGLDLRGVGISSQKPNCAQPQASSAMQRNTPLGVLVRFYLAMIAGWRQLAPYYVGWPEDSTDAWTDWDGQPITSFPMPLPHAPTIRDQKAYAAAVEQDFIALEQAGAWGDLDTRLAEVWLRRLKYGALTQQLGSDSLLTPYGSVPWSEDALLLYQRGRLQLAELAVVVNAWFHSDRLDPSAINAAPFTLKDVRPGTMIGAFGHTQNGLSDGNGVGGFGDVKAIEEVFDLNAKPADLHDVELVYLYLMRWWEERIQSWLATSFTGALPYKDNNTLEVTQAYDAFEAGLGLASGAIGDAAERYPATFAPLYRDAVTAACKVINPQMEAACSTAVSEKSAFGEISAAALALLSSSEQQAYADALQIKNFIVITGATGARTDDEATFWQMWEKVKAFYAARYPHAFSSDPQSRTMRDFLDKVTLSFEYGKIGAEVLHDGTMISLFISEQAPWTLYTWYRALLHEALHVLDMQTGKNSARGLAVEGSEELAEDLITPDFLAWLAQQPHAAGDRWYIASTQAPFYTLDYFHFASAFKLATVNAVTDLMSATPIADSVTYVRDLALNRWQTSAERAERAIMFAHRGYSYLSRAVGRVVIGERLAVWQAAYPNHRVDPLGLFVCGMPVPPAEVTPGLEHCFPPR